MKDNLKLWDSVKKTDPKHTKQANVKGNKITSIKPQYQIYNATKEWGSYGKTWGFKNITLGYELKDVGLVTFKALFYYPDGEFEILNTISFWDYFPATAATVSNVSQNSRTFRDFCKYYLFLDYYMFSCLRLCFFRCSRVAYHIVHSVSLCCYLKRS